MRVYIGGLTMGCHSGYAGGPTELVPTGIFTTQLTFLLENLAVFMVVGLT